MSGGLSQKVIEALRSPLAVRVEFHETIGSTQERARDLVHRSCAPHGTLVVTRVQTGGRGRHGRGWVSPEGGIWMSLILRPEMLAEHTARVTQTAAVAVAKALWESGVEARIKWPNDLLVGDPPERKICGILAEAGVSGGPANDQVSFVVLGVGLNANLDPEEISSPDYEAATVRSELGRDVDLVFLLGSILSRLEEELGRVKDFGPILDDWRALNCTLGHRVRVRRFGETLEGNAADLTPEGALLLRTPRGEVELFEGEVERLRGA